ncbi:MAG TPA: hypothetical protein VGH32_09670 [Pirellulales bacterium]
MSRADRITWACALSLALAVVLHPGPSQAADDSADKGAKATEKAATLTPDKSAAEKPQKKTIDLFDAVKRGDVDLKFVAKDSHDGRLLVKNNTDQPLSVKLPEAFAAVPVLAQAAAGGAGAGGGTRSNRSSNNQNNQNQSVGGGFGGGGGGGYGGGGGAFDVAPEKVAKFKLEMVCLEHGKKEPTAAVPYEIEPIATYTSDPKVQELCKLMGTGEVSQQAAQAAAWHLANHMTWEQLIDKKTHHLLGGDEIYFSAGDIRSAMQITDRAIKMAENREPSAAFSASAPDTTAKSAGK